MFRSRKIVPHRMLLAFFQQRFVLIEIVTEGARSGAAMLAIGIAILVFALCPTCVTADEDVGAIGDAGLGVESGSPFVIGYERFRRYGDLGAVDSGSLLISEFGCAACHRTKDPSHQVTPAPDLTNAGHRLSRDWVSDYLEDPHGAVSGTRMPDPLWMLDETTRRATVEDIAAFLGAQQQAIPLPRANGASPVLHEFWEKGNTGQGRDLYHTIGCVACHAMDPDYERMEGSASSMDRLLEQLDPEEIEELGLTRQLRPVPSIPAFVPGELSQLGKKYSKKALTLFLLDPHRARPSGRMPSLRLTPSEAADLAAYLILDSSQSSGVNHVDSAKPFDAERVQKGRSAFGKFGCANCHKTSGNAEPRAAPTMLELDLNSDTSCYSSPEAIMPRYRLDDQQIKDVVASIEMLQRKTGSSTVDPKAQASHRVKMQMIRLNCVGCHQRSFTNDEPLLGGIGKDRRAFFETTAKIDIGDEGRFPPSLTGVGGKLTEAALKGVFGAKAVRHRPFMTIRMPAYHQSLVDELIRDLPVADSELNGSESKFLAGADQGATGEMLSAGRELINTGCVECHIFREEQLPGAVGVDLHGIEKRLTPRWFRKFVENPERLKHRTRMPTFFPDGKSNRQDLLGGDIDRQIAAIWYYLKKTDPLPEKILEAMAKDFELVPKDRPEVVRTFMDRVGTHAVAVGFPQGVHFAFDSEAVRLSSLWRGRFLDARGTWFERFVPLTKPLGDDQVLLPSGPTFMVSPNEPSDASPDQMIFNGYQLDATGTPTFLYQIAGWSIADRISPLMLDDGNQDAGRSILRRLKIERLDKVAGGDTQSGSVVEPATPRSNDNEDADAAINHSSTVEMKRLVLNLHRGKVLSRIHPYTYQSESGLRVSLRSGEDESIMTSLESSQLDPQEQVWLVEIDPSLERTMEVIYEW